MTFETAFRSFAKLCIDAYPNCGEETELGFLSAHAEPTVLVNNVHAIPQSLAFECPEELLATAVKQPGATPSNRNRIHSWSEDHLTALLGPVLMYLVREVAGQFRLNLDGQKCPPATPNARTPHITISKSGEVITFIEFEAPKVIANPDVFAPFPFGRATPTATWSTTFSSVFTQVAYLVASSSHRS